MDDTSHGRKHRACMHLPLRALHVHQNNAIWKRKRGASQGNPQEATWEEREFAKPTKRTRLLNACNSASGRGPAGFGPVSVLTQHQPRHHHNEDAENNLGVFSKSEDMVSGDREGRDCSTRPCLTRENFLAAKAEAKPPRVTCIFCRKWSGSLEDFAWHVSQDHGIPINIAVSIIRCQSKLSQREDKEEMGALLEESIRVWGESLGWCQDNM